MQFLTNLFNTERSEFSLDGILNRSEGEDRFYDFVDRLFFGQPLNLDHFLNEIRDNGFVLTDEKTNNIYNFLHDN
ncbi:Hypothetical protein ZAZAV_21 [Cedratvirus Zaza IHUMI]|uniref:Uncharacterized protein n=1 Tax=Cedratvirus Zaza IHUMI TaxID=2126979 RepID=A0A2R8FDA3_9VIRU|nr:Hypothetical protein ZAZAV_21 [Cedratvirus Zaza IHUMI]